MEFKIARQILSLNYQFYQSFAGDFSETRGRLQPGVLSILNRLELEGAILDLGCGNGELACHLNKKGFQGSYLGTDFSPALLEEASRRNSGSIDTQFFTLDLAQSDWSKYLPARTFDIVFCFAALHHIPSQELRLSVCRNIHHHLKEGSRLFLSNWQFLKSERLKARILPWEKVGLDQDQVDEGDFLLDWRRGGLGIRYVHHFNLEELSSLAAETGFNILESFPSDGKEGNLSLYQVWEVR
jgi:SAM-dependent methyltransferase